jgi:hypothetical protein
MSETWKASEAGAAGGVLVLGWWLSWIVCGVVGRVGDVIVTPTPGERPNLDSLINGSWVYLASDCLRILAGVLAILIVIKISGAQTRMVGAGGNVAG